MIENNYKPSKPRFDKRCYAVYRGDTFIDLGTIEELSKKFNIKRKQLQWYKSPTALRRLEKQENAMIMIRIEEDDE